MKKSNEEKGKFVSRRDFIAKSTNSGSSWYQIRESFQDKMLIGSFFINDLEGWACG